MVLQPSSAASADPALHCGPEGSRMAVDMAIHTELHGPQSLYTRKREESKRKREILNLKEQITQKIKVLSLFTRTKNPIFTFR